MGRTAGTCRWLARLGGLLVVVTFMSVGCATTTAVPRPPSPSPSQVRAVPATVTVNAHALTGPIPADFAGFSIEPVHLCALLQLERSNPALDQLFRNLAPLIVRFGGNSMERSSWRPDQPCYHLTFGMTTIAEVSGFADRVDARLIWGLNLRADDPNAAADEAAAMALNAGDRLLALELGNEPNTWTTETNFSQSWEGYAAAIAAQVPSLSLAGPAMGNPGGSSWLRDFVQAEHTHLTLVTTHLYPLARGATPTSQQAPTVQNLLSPLLMARTTAGLDDVVALARAYDLPLEVGETNSVSGGMSGVSDVAAAALWGADYLFTAAEHRVRGVAFHGNGGVLSGPPYDPLAVYSGSNVPYARPLYYGMLLFHVAAEDGQSLPVGAQVTSRANLAGHALQTRSGLLRVILINKDLQSAVQARVMFGTAGHTYHQACMLRLLTPGLTATSGITLGGVSVAGDGRWSPRAPACVPLSGSSVTVTVSRASAVLITLSPQSGASAILAPSANQPSSPSQLGSEYQQAIAGRVTVFCFGFAQSGRWLLGTQVWGSGPAPCPPSLAARARPP